MEDIDVTALETLPESRALPGVAAAVERLGWTASRHTQLSLEKFEGGRSCQLACISFWSEAGRHSRPALPDWLGAGRTTVVTTTLPGCTDSTSSLLALKDPGRAANKSCAISA